MILYFNRYWGFHFLWSLRGSVIPKAFGVALPSGVLCGLFHLLILSCEWGKELKDQLDGLLAIWAGYSTVLGVLLVFRNDQAKLNFDNGANGVSALHGDWFDAVGSLFTYCSKDPRKKAEVDKFQYSLIRLTSALHCFALQQVCDMEDDTLEIIKFDKIDAASRAALSTAHDRCELVVQWMKQLIIQAYASGVVEAEAPHMASYFAAIGRGMVNLNKTRNIAEIRFPFPYLQTLTAMLLIHWLVTPLIAASAIESWYVACIMVFLCVASFWCLHYIANELDQPFGDDINDLPVKEMQQDLNRSLLVLLEKKVEAAPVFKVDRMHLPATTLAASSSGVMKDVTHKDEGYAHNRFTDIVHEDAAHAASERAV